LGKGDAGGGDGCGEVHTPAFIVVNQEIDPTITLAVLA
jgi:hypothetical protein